MVGRVERTVVTQQELDTALQKHPNTRLMLVGNGWFRIYETTHVEAWGTVHVEARHSTHVVARDHAYVVAKDRAHVVVRDHAHVVAWDSAHIEAREGAHVAAWDHAHVAAWDHAHVEAWSHAHVEAWDHAHVEAWGHAHVEARHSTHVEARSHAHVVARNSAYVVARDRAYVEASQYVAIHQYGDQAQIIGGVLIKIPKPTTPLEWCAFYGVTVEGEVAILYKAVRDDYRSAHGGVYTPGTIPQAPDWDGGKIECGSGLHFSADPLSALLFDSAATRFVACPVALADIVVHPNPNDPSKIKAPRVAAPIYEVSRYGKRLNREGTPLCAGSSPETSARRPASPSAPCRGRCRE